MCQCTPGGSQDGVRVVFIKDKTGRRVIAPALLIQINDAVRQSAGTVRNRYRAIGHAVHLVEPAGFVTGGYQQTIGAGFDAVSQALIVADMYRKLFRVAISGVHESLLGLWSPLPSITI